MTLQVGHIAYANCTPFFFYLAECGFTGQIVSEFPNRLNALLAQGDIDVGPASSFEYGRNWSDYLLFPDLSISSSGPVQSVLLFTHQPLERMASIPIVATSESATSVNLLRILFKEFMGFTAIFEDNPQKTEEEHIAAGGSALLIGDRALKAAKANLAPQVYDLGELWWRFTQLPFVFALWIIRKEAAAAKSNELVLLQQQLHSSLARTLSDPLAVAALAPEGRWLGQQQLVSYWRTMSYGLSAGHRAGLELFFRLAVKHQFLSTMPELRFFKPVST